jgi:hypothetical protein
MVSRLGHHVKKAVLVSIPAIFSDARARECHLVDFEPTGLWLESVDLWHVVFPDAERPPSAVFVPFTHIAYLVDAPPPQEQRPPRLRTDPPTHPDPPKTRRTRSHDDARKKRA